MSGFLTTHVLDLSKGIPAQGLKIQLYYEGLQVAEMVTNADGRTDSPILPAEKFKTGDYRLLFMAGDYLATQSESGSVFLKQIPIEFTMDQESHYHVPLLLSPYGYSTYRGS